MELNMPVRIVFVDDIHFDATTAVDVIWLNNKII
jgi:hypothetical protein